MNCLVRGFCRPQSSLCLLVVLAASCVESEAAPISPASYEMFNGQSGGFTYYDDSYDGSGDVTVPLAPLSGGTGDLTDGVIPSQSWNQNAAPFVGWLTINPTIRFNFEQTAKINGVTLYFDDTEGQGSVSAPLSVSFSDGTHFLTVPVNDTPDRGQLVVPINDLPLQGDWIDVMITKSTGWVMLSEVAFDGQYVPEPAVSGLALLAALAVVRRRSR